MRKMTRSAAAIAVGMAAVGSVALAAPASASSYQLAEEPACAANYFTSSQKWEINWGNQTTDTKAEWSSIDFGGLTYIDPQYADKTPAAELAAIDAYNNDAAHPERLTNDNAAYHWWYVSRDMAQNGATLVLGFADGDIVSGEATVGSDHCPAVRWTHYNAAGNVVQQLTPATYPDVPLPPKPEIPAADDGAGADGGPLGSLGSLSGLFGSLGS